MLTPEEEQKLDKIIQETIEYLSVRDYDHVPWLAEKLKALNNQMKEHQDLCYKLQEYSGINLDEIEGLTDASQR